MTTYSSNAPNPASWPFVNANMQGELEQCQKPDFRSTKAADCAAYLGKTIVFKRAIVRVGYAKEPLDMPKAEMANRIVRAAREELGIDDLAAAMSRARLCYGSLFGVREYETMDEAIIRTFNPLLYRVRGSWRSGDIQKREVFAHTFDEPMVALVTEVVKRKIGTTYPARSYSTDEGDDYDPAEFDCDAQFSLLVVGRVDWEARKPTPLYVHPDDVIGLRPDIDEFYGRT